jgi:hypothetical protein
MEDRLSSSIGSMPQIGQGDRVYSLLEINKNVSVGEGQG